MNLPEFSELFTNWVEGRGAYPTGLNPYSNDLKEFVEYCLLMYGRDPGPQAVKPVETTLKWNKESTT